VPGLSAQLEVPILWLAVSMVGFRLNSGNTSQAVQVAASSMSVKMSDTVLLFAKAETALLVVSESIEAEQNGKMPATKAITLENSILARE